MKPDTKYWYSQITQQRRTSFFLFVFMFVCYGHVHQLRAEEPLDFIAEHILEVPMDIRYQSLPKIPEQWDSSSKRFQIGGGEVSGGKMTRRFPMFSVNFYQPSDSNSGWLFSLFYENYQFSGRQGNSLLRPSFVRSINLALVIQIIGLKGINHESKFPEIFYHHIASWFLCYKSN